MTKFQMKMVRFARVVLWSEFVFFAGSIVGIVIMILSILKYGEVVAVALYVVFLVVVGVLFEEISRWAERRFIAKFCLLPRSRNEKEVLEKLRKLAVWLGRELKNADNIVPPGLKNSVIRELKNSFWSTWRLAKAMGFPVFKSWKTHAQIKFVEGEF